MDDIHIDFPLKKSDKVQFEVYDPVIKIKVTGKPDKYGEQIPRTMLIYHPNRVYKWIQKEKPQNIQVLLEKHGNDDFFRTLGTLKVIKTLEIRLQTYSQKLEYELFHHLKYTRICNLIIPLLNFDTRNDEMAPILINKVAENLHLLESVTIKLCTPSDADLIANVMPTICSHSGIKNIGFLFPGDSLTGYVFQVNYSAILTSLRETGFKGKLTILPYGFGNPDFINVTSDLNEIIKQTKVTTIETRVELGGLQFIEFRNGRLPQLGTFIDILGLFDRKTFEHLASKGICRRLDFDGASLLAKDVHTILDVMRLNHTLIEIGFSSGKNRMQKDVAEIEQLSRQRISMLRLCIRSSETLIAVRKFRQSWLQCTPKEIVLMLAKFLFETYGDKSWFLNMK